MKIEPSLQSRKSEFRKLYRNKRAAIPAEQRPALDRAINEHLLSYIERSAPAVVSAYFAFDGEPDLAPAMAAMQASGVRVALPVIRHEPGRSVLDFHEWHRGCSVARNQYGIEEPENTEPVRLREIELCLIPLVAWDASGGRLGMGASFYDRLLQPFSMQSRPVRMGVGYQVQKAADIPLEPWDIRMHMILSEAGCQDFVGQGAEQQ